MRICAILMLLAVAACASPEAELAKQAPQTLAGMPKGELLACAGVPARRTSIKRKRLGHQCPPSAS